MAGITGRLSADFSAFNAAVQQAEVQLKSFETGGAKVTTQLTALGNSLSGTRVIQQATLMSEAIERMGGEGGTAAGLLKLTDAELQRVGSSAQEATAKLIAMGQDVPPGIKKIADATANAEKETTSFMSSLGSMAATLGVAFSVGSIVNFAKSVVDTGSKIEETSVRLGISTDAVQGFKFAAEQSGSSLDAVTTAITKMQKNIEEGSKATVTDLKKLGLSFKDVADATPEEAFLKITDAIQKIPDPMTQTEVALRLFGKGAGEILPAIKTGFREAADSADKMSAQTVKDLKDAEDAWRRLGNTVTVITGGFISKTGQAFSGMAAGIKSAFSSPATFAAFADNVIKYGIGPATAMSAAFGQMGESSKKAAADINLTLPTHKKSAEELAAEAEAAKKLQAVIDSFSAAAVAAKIKELNAAVNKLGGESKLTGPELGRVADQAAKLFAEGGTLSPQLLDIAIKFNGLLPPVKEGTAALEKFGEKINGTTIPAAAALAEEVDKLASSVRMASASGIEGLGLKVPVTLPREIVALEIDIKRTRQSVIDLGAAFINLGRSVGGPLGDLIQMSGDMFKSIQIGMGDFKKGLVDLSGGNTTAGFNHLAASFANIAAAAARAGSAIIATWNNVKSKTQGALTGAETGASIGTGILPGWGTAIGAGVGAIVGLIKGMSAGRDAVVKFAASFGGFDVLQQKLGALGPAGDKLWKALSNVGKSDAKGAEAAINAVNAALTTQANKIADVQAQIEALGGNGVPSLDAMTAAAGRLGISTDALGDAFHKAQSAADWQSTIDDIDTLVRGGADLNTVIEGSVDKLDAMALQSKKFGTEIPENAKPWLEQLAREGKLLDENGQKMSESQVDGLSFGESMQTTLKKLNDTLEKLIGTIGGVGSALDTVGGKVVNPKIKLTYDDSGAPGSSGGGTPAPTPEASGGDYYVTKPTRFLVGEAGPERVSFSGASRADMAGGGSGSITVQLILQDGRMLAELVVPHIPTVVNELGLNRP